MTWLAISFLEGDLRDLLTVHVSHDVGEFVGMDRGSSYCGWAGGLYPCLGRGSHFRFAAVARAGQSNTPGFREKETPSAFVWLLCGRGWPRQPERLPIGLQLWRRHPF